MNIGCHISIAGGIENAPQRAAVLGCEIMQIFTRAPQGGKTLILTDKIRSEFKSQNAKCKIKEVYIHCPYYINLASANNRIRYGSIKTIRDELERGSLLGAKFAITHLGSAKDLGKEESLKKSTEMLNKSLDKYAGSCKLLLENSAGAGEIIGDDLRELAEIVKLADDKNIAGICLDTQHSFASGYDWRDFEKTLQRINEEIDLEKIKLIHCNDSLTDFNSRKDRHTHIGQGKIGLDAFEKITRFAKEKNIDMICETEYGGVRKDIEILKRFRDK